MSALNPTVHQEFKNRHFAVRRISTFWSGVYPDLYIEQTFMARSPQVPQVWQEVKVYRISARLFGLLSQPGVLTIDMKMKEMRNVSFKLSDQRIALKKARPSRITRNINDTQVITKFCESRHLMQIDSLGKLDKKLKNIATGLIVPNKVNTIDVKNCGEIIINKMEVTFPLTYSFKRIMRAVQMPTSSDILNKKMQKFHLIQNFYSKGW